MPSIALPVSLRGQLLYSAAFDPSRLAVGSTSFLWLDPSDLTTLFQDTAGTTPVTTPGQTVALALDKSKGLVLGSELVTNGDFATDANWIKGTGWVITGGAAVATAASGALDQDGVFGAAGNFYRVTFTVTSFVSGDLTISFGTGFGQFLDITGPGTYTVYGRNAGATASKLRFTPVGSTTLSIDNISVKELPGFHATQSSSSFRPAYQTTPQRFNFDGSDDRLNFAYSPTTSGSLAVRINGASASRVAIGSQGATDGRCFIGLASDGSLAAGIGTQTTATIKGSTDIRGTWTTGVVTWDGTTVRLYQNGAEVYSGAQSGAVNTTIPFDLGCLNNNGTRAAFWGGGIGAAIALGRVMTPAEVSSLHQFWSNIA